MPILSRLMSDLGVSRNNVLTSQLFRRTSASPELRPRAGTFLLSDDCHLKGRYRKYKNGAVGMMLHAVALHGVDYSIELEVYADGVGVLFLSTWTAR